MQSYYKSRLYYIIKWRKKKGRKTMTHRSLYKKGDILKQIENLKEGEDSTCKVLDMLGVAVYHKHINKKLSGVGHYKEFELIEEVKPVQLIREPKTIKKEGLVYKVICFYDPGMLGDTIINESLLLANKIKRDVALIDWTDDTIFKQIRLMTEKHKIEPLKIILPNRLKTRDDYEYPSIDFNFIETPSNFTHFGEQYHSFKDELGVFNVENININKDGMLIASSSKNILQMFLDGFTKEIPKKDSEAYLKYIFNFYIMAHKMFESKEGRQTLREVGKYRDFRYNLSSIMKENLREKISQFHSDTYSHYTAIQRNQKSVHQHNLHLDDVDRKEKIFKETFQEEKLIPLFHPLIKDKKITEITYTRNEIHLYTGPIYVKSWGKSYLIGKSFQIIINYQEGWIKMINRDGQKHGKDHPHISQNSPCFGNLKELIPNLIFDGRFEELFVLMYEYLCTYNDEAPYLHVEKFWGKPEDWCDECDRPSISCRHNRCQYCEKIKNECQCAKCPIHGKVRRQHICVECCHFLKGECKIPFKLQNNENRGPGTMHEAVRTVPSTTTPSTGGGSTGAFVNSLSDELNSLD